LGIFKNKAKVLNAIFVPEKSANALILKNCWFSESEEKIRIDVKDQGRNNYPYL